MKKKITVIGILIIAVILLGIYVYINQERKVNLNGLQESVIYEYYGGSKLETEDTKLTLYFDDKNKQLVTSLSGWTFDDAGEYREVNEQKKFDEDTLLKAKQIIPTIELLKKPASKFGGEKHPNTLVFFRW